MRRALAVPVVVVFLGLPSVTGAAVPPEALELRDRGLAHLENEEPAEAAEVFKKLVKIVPDDPLGWANLAIASLRQQKGTEAVALIERALKLTPERADLLHVKGDVLQWTGRPQRALEVYRGAAENDPEDPEILYSLYRQADTLTGEAAEGHARWALDHLARLRPDNVVVLLQRGQQAVAAGDRQAATESFLRIGELLWQAPPIAERALQMVLDALEEDDPAQARVPAVRMENVLKVTPMFQQGLRELSTGIQGIPIWRFEEETPARAFGDPLDLGWSRRSLDSKPGVVAVLADFDGDRRQDIAWIAEGEEPGLELRRASEDWKGSGARPAPGIERLRAVDLDNDGNRDLLAIGPAGLRGWKGDGAGGLEDSTEAWGLKLDGSGALTVFDFDIEGDLDLIVGREDGGALVLFRNDLEGPLETIESGVFPDSGPESLSDLDFSDLDRDGDPDLLVAHGGLTWLDNLRQGQFADRTGESGLSTVEGARRVTTGDLNADGFPDLIVAGNDLEVRFNREGRFPAVDARIDLPGPARDLALLDAHNDGRLDLAVATEAGLVLVTRDSRGRLRPKTLEGSEAELRSVAPADLDGDGDLDLVTAGGDGLAWWENRGGDENHWLAVRLRGLDKGNSKNNLFGLGSVVEIRNGPAYQFREVRDGVVHFGLGDQRSAEVLRVVWTNGVPQNRLRVQGDQTIVEEQILKGSCPFLYAWNGEEIAFVTDLLWASPVGLPVTPGVWAPADPSELVEVEGARPRDDGVYDLRVTEELWEAAFFDRSRLWIVDHPRDVEVASNLRVVPGEKLPERVLASRSLRPVAAARNGEGDPVTDRVRRRDEVFASGYPVGRLQGFTPRPWTFTFDLGEPVRDPIRLHLDGWIFPSDASLNLAAAQRDDLEIVDTRLEVEIDGRWIPLLDPMGFPAGKTKTMVLDLPTLPAPAHRFRIVSSQWLAWDRIAWTRDRADEEIEIVARLDPTEADLRYRGFSRMVRSSPSGPHRFDYASVETESPWLPFPGRYTRYGDVAELLLEADDRSVILGAGDEMRLLFDASGLPDPPEGWRRTVFLESHGWDKDADRNTYRAESVDPLPLRGMSGYPYGPGEELPPELDAYREEWLTRVVTPEEPSSVGDSTETARAEDPGAGESQ